MPSVTTQAVLGWRSPGSPGSLQESAWKAKYLVRAEAIHSVKTLLLHRAVVVHFNALNLYLQKNGAKLGEKVDDWGWANRDIRGFSGTKSYHAWALAEDLDATEHPLGQRHTTFADNERERNEIRLVCKLLGLRWGYDYSGRPDPMHFEFIKSFLRARRIRRKLVKPTRKSRRLAELCNLDVDDFCRRVRKYSDIF